MVRGVTIDNEFPADAHVVIEGSVPRNERDREGPFGEYTGYYGEKFDDLTVIDVCAMIIREIYNPYFMVRYRCRSKMTSSRRFRWKRQSYFSLRKNCPQVKQVRCPRYGGSDDFVIVQLKKTYEDEGKVAILSAFAATGSRPKIVIVVDDDVDIFNEAEVLNAVTYRMQPGKDVTIVRTQGNPLDPSYLLKAPEGGYCMGMDATKPLAGHTEKIENHSTSKELPQAFEV